MSTAILPQFSPLVGERLLTACEQALAEPAPLRAITLLAAALPQCGRDALLGRPLAESVRLLLELHRATFGCSLDGYAACPACGTAMEFSMTVDAALDALTPMQPHDTVTWSDGGATLHLREASTADLVAVIDTPDDALAGARLLARCLGFDDWSEQAQRCASLPSARARFETLHAASELRCELQCPACRQAATWDLDVGHLVWLEARHAARRLLSDVHALASHYGWSEAAIVAMSQHRRDAYLERLDT
jgi:hypothetical protein